MFARILVLGVIALGLAIHAGLNWQRQAQIETVMTNNLVPRSVPGWQAERFWTFRLAPGVWQEYGRYRRDGLQLTLSFDHFSPYTHDAFVCFAGRGAVRQYARVQAFNTRDGVAQMNLGGFAVTRGVAVVASSRCEAAACVPHATSPGVFELLSPRFWWRRFNTPSAHAMPMSISIESPAVTTEADYPRLEQAVSDFVAQLDLAPVRQTAALESTIGWSR